MSIGQRCCLRQMLLKRLALRRPMSQKFQLWFRVPRSAPSHYTLACDASRLECSRSLTALSSSRPLSFPGVIAGFATGKAEFSGAFFLLTRAIHVPIARSQTPAFRRRTLGPHCRRAHIHEVMFGTNGGARWTLRCVCLHLPGLSMPVPRGSSVRPSTLEPPI